MLYEFLLPLTQYESAFNIFRYISFRAAGAAITSLLVCFVVGPWILARLRAIDLDGLTPREALNLLAELRREIDRG